MHLVHSTSMKLEEFPSECMPKYAILSHRWQDDEVTFQQMQNGSAIHKAGYTKVKLSCERAARDGLQYIWVDTCCIDKTNNVALSESINSMYRLYQNADVCYVYLFDVHSRAVTNDSSFDESSWFTRGWTLQELIAPSHIEFYNSTWYNLGTRRSLGDKIAAITNIDVTVFQGANLESFSVARRMSWASERTSTRAEDNAYCLLGIFGVNMPMLYGEGERAFIRLQEEIMKQSDDHSLFAWSSSTDCYRGLLAKSPADFRGCANIVSPSSRLNRIPYSITNMGLSIELLMIPWAMETYLAALDCEVENAPNRRVGVFLKLLPETDQCARVRLDGTDRPSFDSELIPQSQYRKVYVRQRIWDSPPSLDRMYGFWLRKLLPCENVPRNKPNFPSEVISWNPWTNDERKLEIPTGSHGTAGVVWFGDGDEYSVMRLGFDNMFNPLCQLGGPLWIPPMRIRKYYAPAEGSFEMKMDHDWMNRRSEYVKQGGGYVRAPERRPMFPNRTGFSEQEFSSVYKEGEWVDRGADYVFKGDRITGLNNKKGRGRVSITEEIIDNQRVWAVDLEYPTGVSMGGTCDGCKFKMYETRFKCQMCKDFDYCLECFSTAKETHPLHDFREIKK